MNVTDTLMSAVDMLESKPPDALGEVADFTNSQGELLQGHFIIHELINELNRCIHALEESG